VDPEGRKPSGPSSRQVDFQGLKLTIEYDKGDFKQSKEDPIDGISSGWPMYADYGYINGTISPEIGEETDCYVGPDKDSEKAFTAVLLKWDGITLDEEKVLLGFKDLEAATELINLQYGSYKVHSVSEISLDDLKQKANLEQFKNYKEKLLLAAEGLPGTTSPDLDTGEEFDEEPRLVIEV